MTQEEYDKLYEDDSTKHLLLEKQEKFFIDYLKNEPKRDTTFTSIKELRAHMLKTVVALRGAHQAFLKATDVKDIFE